MKLALNTTKRKLQFVGDIEFDLDNQFDSTETVNQSTCAATEDHVLIEQGTKRKRKATNLGIKNEIPPKKPKNCVCPIKNCGKKMVYPRNIQRHIDTFHGEINEKGVYQIRRLQCATIVATKTCNKVFLNDFNF